MLQIISTPIGQFEIDVDEKTGALLRLTYLPENVAQEKQNIRNENGISKPFADIAAQINAYFVDPNHSFTLLLNPQGTEMQKLIWNALRAIPARTTKTYGELACALNTSPRVIGNACRANPIPIIIPCHRVVGAKSIGGYAGATDGVLMDIKAWLLNHEHARFNAQ